MPFFEILHVKKITKEIDFYYFSRHIYIYITKKKEKTNYMGSYKNATCKMCVCVSYSIPLMMSLRACFM